MPVGLVFVCLLLGLKLAIVGTALGTPSSFAIVGPAFCFVFNRARAMGHCADLGQ